MFNVSFDDFEWLVNSLIYKYIELESNQYNLTRLQSLVSLFVQSNEQMLKITSFMGFELRKTC